MARHVKKNDMVQIVVGDEKGATGRVMRVIPEKQCVIVQGRNLAQKHVRPSRRNPQGGRITVERPIHISNVLPVNPKDSQATKIKFEIDDDGNKKRMAKDGTEIGVTKRAKE